MLNCKRFVPECVCSTQLNIFPFHCTLVLYLLVAQARSYLIVQLVFFNLVWEPEEEYHSCPTQSSVLCRHHFPWISRTEPFQWSHPTLSCEVGTSSYFCSSHKNRHSLQPPSKVTLGFFNVLRGQYSDLRLCSTWDTGEKNVVPFLQGYLFPSPVLYHAGGFLGILILPSILFMSTMRSMKKSPEVNSSCPCGPWDYIFCNQPTIQPLAIC